MVLDIIGGLILLVFAAVDFLRGAIRVLGGMIALVFAVVMSYFFSTAMAEWISSQFGLDTVTMGSKIMTVHIPVGYLLGILVTFLVCYVPGLFLFPFLLRKIFRNLNKIEEMAMEEEKPSAPPAPTAPPKKEKEKKPEKAPAPKVEKGPSQVEKEVEAAAEEIQLSLMERLLGGLLGLVKGTVIVSLFLFFIHFLPTPEVIQNAIGKSFFGKLYDQYIARAIERQSPEFKVLNNMGYLIEIGSRVMEKPETLEKLRKHKSLEEIQKLKPVQSLLQDQEFMEWAQRQPYLEVLKSPKIKELLRNPEVVEKLAEIDVKELRNDVR